jgi:dTDP-4-dehydrorhamnose reductase
MIIVTGASGFLGSNFVLAGQQRYKELVAAFHQRRVHLPGLKAVQADLTDMETVQELFQAVKPDWVVHCAALTNVDWCEAHPDETWRVNVEMSRNLAITAHKAGANLVYVSTDSVFDGQRGHYAEEDIPAPVNVYAHSKLAGEKAVREESEHSLVVRTNFYGWSWLPNVGLAEWLLNRLELAQSVPGFDDVIFTPILVNDLCQIVLDMMELDLRGVYHVSGSQPCSKYEFALQLADVFALDKQLVQPMSIADSTLRAPRPRNTALQTVKISQALRRRMPDVKSGLRCFKALRESGYVIKLRSHRGG